MYCIPYSDPVDPLILPPTTDMCWRLYKMARCTHAVTVTLCHWLNVIHRDNVDVVDVPAIVIWCDS